MRKIQREVKTFEEVYVSVDGKEFRTEEDCKMWEKSYKGTIEASWKLIKKETVCSCDLGLPCSSYDNECYAIKPESLEEITLINAYIKCSVCNTAEELTTEHIGKLVILDFGYDRDWCDICILADEMKKRQEHMEALEKKFTDSTAEEAER